MQSIKTNKEEFALPHDDNLVLSLVYILALSLGFKICGQTQVLKPSLRSYIWVLSLAKYPTKLKVHMCLKSQGLNCMIVSGCQVQVRGLIFCF